jgi:hypothetical protein
VTKKFSMVRERFGLDYFGIDCGLDRDGNLIAFEVNASMLVHDDNEEFPYKAPTGMIVRHGLCEDRTDMKIDRSIALVSRMMVSSIALPPLPCS